MATEALPPEFRFLESRATRVAVHQPFRAAASGARHAFSIKDGEGRCPGLVETLEAAGLRGCEAAGLDQVHGEAVVLRRREDCCDAPLGRPADAQTTRDGSIALVIQSADCVPVLLADPVSGAVGAAHSGWRGTVLGIASRLVERMSIDHGSDPRDLVALLGPAIGPCCYEVRDDVASIFRRRFPARRGFLQGSGPARRAAERLDLVGANKFLLLRAGLREGNLFRSGLCTACRTDLFPSYRAQGSGAGRLFSLLAPPPAGPAEI